MLNNKFKKKINLALKIIMIYEISPINIPNFFGKLFGL
jgi:hypothetical protein